ncbi:MAG: hypothetical protein R3F23_07910 [Verrucomicrobiia bacterium]
MIQQGAVSFEGEKISEENRSHSTRRHQIRQASLFKIN